MAFTLGRTVAVCMAYKYYAHARVDEIDLDAKSQWVGKGKISALNYLEDHHQASNKH